MDRLKAEVLINNIIYAVALSIGLIKRCIFYFIMRYKDTHI